MDEIIAAVIFYGVLSAVTTIVAIGVLIRFELVANLDHKSWIVKLFSKKKLQVQHGPDWRIVPVCEIAPTEFVVGYRSYALAHRHLRRDLEADRFMKRLMKEEFSMPVLRSIDVRAELPDAALVQRREGYTSRLIPCLSC